MRKFLTFLLLAACSHSYSQSNTLFHSTMVKPKIGQAKAFENAWKTHVAKFHKSDNKRVVYEILSGDMTGYYQMVEGPSSFADMDKDNPQSAAHDLDYNTMVASNTDSEMGHYMYRVVDSLNYNGDVNTGKYVYTIYNLKAGKMPDMIAEIMRSVAVNKSITSPASSMVFVKQMAGSAPQMVIVSNLKDGFKQLEQNYFAGLNDKFKNAYIQMHSQALWDKRQTFLQDNTESYASYLVKRRDDLSSK